MAERFVLSPARGEIWVAQGAALAEPWVCGPIPVFSLSLRRRGEGWVRGVS